jgi:hypothetical protein
VFDNYHTHVRSGPTHVSVEEKRAPTDESVKLLREMEQKARDAVVQSVRVDTNEFKGVLNKMHDPLNDQDAWCVVFDLNGKRIEVIERQERWENISEFVPKLSAAVADRIAAHILIAFSDAMPRSKFD